MKVKAICTNVLPCQKAKAAKDDQCSDHRGKQRIVCILCQRNKFCPLCSQQVKTCIAERRNGMKQCIPDPAQSIIGAKCRQQQCSTGQFKQGGDPQNKACQPHDAAHLWGSGGFLHRAALLEGDLSPRKQRKGSAHCNDTQSSDLDQKKDHTLPKSRPVAAGILYYKAGHAKGRSGGKQCLMERCDAPLLRSNRKHQKQCAHQINCRKTCNNDLKRRKTVPLVTRILNHKSSFTYPCA